MTHARNLAFIVAATVVASTPLVARAQPHAATWDPAAAAVYLDTRQSWWNDWPVAAKENGTVCVSCHTATPFALGRSALREGAAPSGAEHRLLASVEQRVSHWHEMEPFYSDERVRPGKTAESRGTEAVLNALILANRDATAGALSDTTRQAFDNLWALQLTNGEAAGGWAWLDFGLAPWEIPSAQFYGATLAAVAVGTAPEQYVFERGNTPRLASLRAYLRGQVDTQPLFNQLHALWASALLPAAIDGQQRQGIIDRATSLQRDDGGWSLASFGTYARSDDTPLDTESDGYATGIAVLALRHAGGDAAETAVRQGRAWLRAHQNADGSWWASSLNKSRDPASDRGKFMRDAATAYAVLALTAGE